MPHDMMNTLHETGMPGSFHWLFWIVVIGVFALLAFLILRFSNTKDKHLTTSSNDKSLSTRDQNDSGKGGNSRE